MKIAVISDIHENAHNLILFFEQIKDENVEQILCLGDFINTGIAKILAAQKIPVFSVWGNNDGERVAITKLSMNEENNLTMGFDTFDTIECDGKNIFLTHYPMLAKPMAKSGDFDAVFYGHDHKKNIDLESDCLILNPGEISAHKTGGASYALYNTETNTAKIFDIEHFITLKTDVVDTYRKESSIEYEQSKSHQY